MDDISLLLEIGVPFLRAPNGLLVEAQALNGLRLWSRHFDRVTVCAIELPPGSSDDSTIVWADPSALLAEGRVSFEPFPSAYQPLEHLRVRRSVAARYGRLIKAHRYLCFSSFGVLGAWGNFAVDQALRQTRAYSVWFDWVLHEMGSSGGSLSLRSLKHRLFLRLTRRVTDRAVSQCALGLFHGQTVYDAYAPICPRPALVHDIHVHPQDAISDEAIEAKRRSVQSRRDIRIGYVGRLHPMKAPLQWIEAIALTAATVGADRISAEWWGDGPLLDEARQRVAALGLEGSIRFPGFVSDRGALLEFLRSTDVMLFCHLMPESPRCLIEALISGTGLVGYESAYAKELVGDRGGTVLSPIGDVAALAANLKRVIEDRGALGQLVVQAGLNRPLYNDEAVFAHRSELIRQYL